MDAPQPPCPPYPPYPPVIVYAHCCCCQGQGHAYGAPGGHLPPGAQVGGTAPPAGGAAPPPAAGGTKPGVRIPNPLEVLLGGAAGAVGGVASAVEDATGLAVAVAGGVSDFLESIF